MTAVEELSYERLAAANENLGDVIDLYAEVMREAVRVAVEQGPAAGMNVLVCHVRSVPELAEGLTFAPDMPGGDR